jgi:ubiquinone biosynthesis protein
METHMNASLNGRRRSFAERLVGGPAGLRERLQRWGPTFIKIGQFLALRPDLVPQEYCNELMRLWDQVPPFAWEKARTILAEELGREPEAIFAGINPTPVAAGSLAQVHVAYLADGTRVAVKVQRPNLPALVARDLKRLRSLARLLEWSGVSLFISPHELVEELTEWMLREIDCRNELANLSRLRDLTANSRIERVPRPYPELSTSRVLTAEYLRGMPVSDLLETLDRLRSGEEVAAPPPGIDRDGLAANLLTATFTQIFRYRFFHADLHPGNLVALPGNVIGYVDFGLCDELDETVRSRQMRYFAAVYSGDNRRMLRALLEILVPGDDTDLDAFQKDFLAETERWDGRGDEHRQGGAPAEGRRSSVSQWMIGVMRAARRHHLQVPRRILSLYRALLAADTVCHQLGARVDLRTVGNDFFTQLQIEEVIRLLTPKSLQRSLFGMVELLRDAPGQIQQVLSELSEGRLVCNASVTEAPRLVRARNRRTRLVVTAILSLGPALLLTAPDLPTVFGVSLTGPLWGTLILLYLSIFLQWRLLE